VHHQPKEMKLSVGFRGSFLDFLMTPHNIIWMPLLGFNPVMVLVVDAFAKMYGVLVHINESWIPTKRWKWFERLFVSPSLHRAHHSTNHLYLDRNYGEALVIWDRLFGTIQPYRESEKLEYGVMKDVDSEDLKDAQLNELRSLWQDMKSAPTISTKLKYAFYPPGWNHFDGGMLADDFRKAAQKS
jgi:sterol desaturase/sphingolipid hydroxylase (fatty acid hydroxylase superfamily)